MGAEKTADKYIARDGGEPATGVADVNARHWSLMTKTRKGHVSILRDLTLYECKEAYVRLNPEYGHTYTSYESDDPDTRPPGSLGGSTSFGGRIVSADEIDLREVFGPSVWDISEVSSWDVWPKHDYIKWNDERHYRHRQQPTQAQKKESPPRTIRAIWTGRD